MQNIRWLCVVIGCFMVAYNQKNCAIVDTIIFSYHRPMQLYALLESMEQYITAGRGQTYVLYRTDCNAYTQAYQFVKEKFPEVSFIKQGNHPKEDFKPLLLHILEMVTADYIMFAVDDIIMTRPIDFVEAVAALVSTNAYAFYLRLGSNITESYTQKTKYYLPRLHKVSDTVLAWDIKNAYADWAYPHTVDMTIYRKAEIEPFLRKASYTGPNMLEAHWAEIAPLHSNKIGLCYIMSRMVNVPYNRVQQVIPNIYMSAKTVEELLHLFMSGKKIAVDDLYDMKNKSAHTEYYFRFIDR